MSSGHFNISWDLPRPDLSLQPPSKQHNILLYAMQLVQDLPLGVSTASTQNQLVVQVIHVRVVKTWKQLTDMTVRTLRICWTQSFQDHSSNAARQSMLPYLTRLFTHLF